MENLSFKLQKKEDEVLIHFKLDRIIRRKINSFSQRNELDSKLSHKFSRKCNSIIKNKNEI